MSKIGLVVTTAHKGVFFGYGTPSDSDTIVLTDCRMCIYWPASVKGVMGLAVTGPLEGSRISPAVPVVTLREVTAVMEATEAACGQWEKGLWK